MINGMRCIFRLTSIFLLIFIVVLAGCKPDSITNSKYRNNKYVWVSESVDGEGHWMRKSFNGAPTPDGYYTMFYHDGVICRKGRILNGDDVDTSFQFDTNGNLLKYRLEDSLVVADYYINDGDVKLYLSTGELLLEGTVENHSLKGPAKVYFKNGELDRIATWDNFQQNGKTVYFFKTGELRAETYWKDGVQHGASTNYYKSGQVYIEADWVRGEEHGVCKQYHRNGRLMRLSRFKKGNREGEGKTFYPSGSLRTKVNLKSDQINGMRFAYYENGEIYSQIEYVEGKPHGKGLFFTYEGIEYGNNEFKNGQEWKVNNIKELSEDEKKQIEIFHAFKINDHYEADD